MEFYHTACRTFTDLFEDGRRQLQALVRLRATSHSSGLALPRSSRSTHRRCPGTGTVKPSGPTLGTHQLHRPPHTTGLSLDSTFGWKRTAPTDAGLDDGANHVGVHKRIRLWRDTQPNGSRLSCGALKNNSFHSLRAPSASSAC